MPTSTWRKFHNGLWYYFIYPLLAIFAACKGYQYFEFRQSHTLIEATVTEHVWKNKHLILRYTYRVEGVSYEGSSDTYGEEIKHRGRRGG